DHRQRCRVDEAQQPPLGESELDDRRDENHREGENERGRSGGAADEGEFFPAELQVESGFQQDEDEAENSEELYEIQGNLYVISRRRGDLTDPDPEQQEHEHGGNPGSGAE